MDLELYEFWKPNASEEVFFYTLEVTSCVRDTKASSEYILKGASIHPTLL